MKWLFLLCIIVGLAATVEDLWRRRVSNVITVGALLAGVGAHTFLYGMPGLWNSLGGAFFGFIGFLIFFLLGGMGGGDIKLMAGLGSIVGGERILLAIVLVAGIGGIMALLFVAVQKLRQMLRSSSGESQPLRKAMIPYAPAISLGMILTFLSEDALWTSV